MGLTSLCDTDISTCTFQVGCGKGGLTSLLLALAWACHPSLGYTLSDRLSPASWPNREGARKCTHTRRWCRHHLYLLHELTGLFTHLPGSNSHRPTQGKRSLLLRKKECPQGTLENTRTNTDLKGVMLSEPHVSHDLK